MTPSINLPEILAAHARWLAGEPDGVRANLSGANLIGADLRGADLRGANLIGVDLIGANLSGVDLSGVDLRGVDLRGADLIGANLIGVDLSGVDLRGADLRGADLRGANLIGVVGLNIAADAPQRLRAVAVAALNDGALEMGSWHSCNTTHCIAGWAIHQAGEVGKLLEAAVGPSIAGLMLLGPEAYKHFHDNNQDATAWLRSVLDQAEDAEA